MARPTLRRVRDNINCVQLNKHGLASDQALKRKILEREVRASGDAALTQVLHRQDKLVAQYKAGAQYRPRRAAQDAQNGATKPQRKDYRSPEGFNDCGLATGRSYASRAGERLEAKKTGFPDVTRHMATVHVAAVPVTGSLDKPVKSARPRFRRVGDRLTTGAQIEGAFQIDMKTAEYIASVLPADEWPPELDPISRPDEVFALLHWHSDISDPWLSKNTIKKMLREEFPGCRRVCVKGVRKKWLTKDGQETGGAQGWLEYLSMDKTKIEFKKTRQTKDAIIGMARLSTTWTKRNRSFSYGKPLAVSGVKIDPDRVAELELQDRLEFVRKNWDKLGAAERFIHIWMSGMVKVIKKDTRWTKFGDSIKDRFLELLSLVKNWSADATAQDIDFMDYVEPLLE